MGKFEKLIIKDVNGEEALRTENKALNQPGNYLESNDILGGINLKIELIEEKLAKKDKEIRDVEELMIRNFLINKDVEEISPSDNEYNRLISKKEKLEKEYLLLNNDKEKLENQKLIFLEKN